MTSAKGPKLRNVIIGFCLALLPLNSSGFLILLFDFVLNSPKADFRISPFHFGECLLPRGVDAPFLGSARQPHGVIHGSKSSLVGTIR